MNQISKNESLYLNREVGGDIDIWSAGVNLVHLRLWKG